MQNMWISVALIVAVIIVGIIAGKRLSTPGPQRRAVYFAFGTLAVLALWFFIFVAFFPAEWIAPFFTVACIIIPICVYMMVLRSGGKERAKVPSKRSFEIPKKDITVESAKAASTVSSGTASASSATTPSKAATPAPSASQQTAPASSTPTSAAKTDTSSAPATKAKAPATAAVATAPTKPATSEAPKATAKPSAEAPKPTQPASKAEAPSTQKSTTESAPVAAPAANADGLSNEDALLVDFLIGKTLNDDVANADDTFALPKGTEITREIALDAKKHDALLLLTMSVD